MTGGPYRKSEIKLKLDEWVGWVKSLSRAYPKQYKILRRAYQLLNLSEPAENELFEEVLSEIDLADNKYYRQAQNNPDTLDNYILMSGPGISKLLVSKERTYYGCRWEEAHLELQKKGFYMPTLRQFVDFVGLIASGEAYDGTGEKVSDSEARRILEEICENNESGEWLDARFIRIKQRLFFGQNYQYKGYGITQWKETLLEPNCLLYRQIVAGIPEGRFCYADVFGSANSQGMPTRPGTILYYPPSEAKPTVATFSNFGEMVLDCTDDPEFRHPAIGVRQVKLILES